MSRRNNPSSLHHIGDDWQQVNGLPFERSLLVEPGNGSSPPYEQQGEKC